MSEARNVAFGEMDWGDDAPGIRAKESEIEGSRWATVEYEAGAGREEWCEDGHRGFVVSGEIEYQFDDESPALRAAAGEAFFLPVARLGEGAHRGRNLSDGPTRLFLIDESAEGSV